MQFKLLATSFLIALTLGKACPAQTSTVNGWFFSSHQQKLSEKWSFLSDIQLRSSDHWKFLETVLLRPGLHYSLSKKHSVAAGYGYLGNWEEANDKKTFDLEHRVWQQYNLKLMMGRTEFNNRLRLEQRFLEGDGGFDFAQRLRYYIRLQIPLAAGGKEFTKGFYAALQNEIFLNIQNKDAVNGRFFDQNRLFGFLGYRFSKKLEAEAGYLFRYRIADEKERNHIVQLVIATSF